LFSSVFLDVDAQQMILQSGDDSHPHISKWITLVCKWKSEVLLNSLIKKDIRNFNLFKIYTIALIVLY